MFLFIHLSSSISVSQPSNSKSLLFWSSVLVRHLIIQPLYLSLSLGSSENIYNLINKNTFGFIIRKKENKVQSLTPPLSINSHCYFLCNSLPSFSICCRQSAISLWFQPWHLTFFFMFNLIGTAPQDSYLRYHLNFASAVKITLFCSEQLVLSVPRSWDVIPRSD